MIALQNAGLLRRCFIPKLSGVVQESPSLYSDAGDLKPERFSSKSFRMLTVTWKEATAAKETVKKIMKSVV